MNEERLSILRTLADGKITAEQANELIKALGDEPPAGAEEEYRPEGAIESSAEAQGRVRQHTTNDFFTELEPDQLIEMKMHGVDANFVREMRELGITDLDQLIEFKIHGIDANFIRQLREFGFTDLEPEQIVEFKIHGVDANYIRQMRSRELK